jgi:general secretion pathway protein A
VYCRYFGLTEKPFDVTPDPAFLFQSEEHREALASLIYGIRERRGFIVLVGEVGTGKTTLLNTVLGQLDEQTQVAYLFNTKLDFDTLLNGALVDLGVSGADEFLNPWEAINRLNDFAVSELREGRNVVLIVDEAQNLDPGSMESFRLLSNLETRKYKLIQIILSGQPELDQKLRDPSLRQLAQRISMRRTIAPLNEADTYAYIRHRLNIAHYKGPALFDRRALQRVWQYSGGIPRKINVLCDNAMLITYGLKKKRVNQGIVDEAIRDLTGLPAVETVQVAPVEMPAPKGRKRRLRPSLAYAFGCTLMMAFLYFLGCNIGLWPNYLSEFWTPSGPIMESIAALRAPADKSPMTKNFVPDATEKNPSSPGNAIQLPQDKPPELKTDRLSLTSDKQDLIPLTLPATLESTVDKPAAEDGVEASSTSMQVPEAPVQRWITVRPSSRPLPGQVFQKQVADPPRERYFKPPAPVAEVQTVVVRPGDTLYGILMVAYGDYNKAWLPMILKENPQLLDADRLDVGQVIRLPEIEDLFLSNESHPKDDNVTSEGQSPIY